MDFEILHEHIAAKRAECVGKTREQLVKMFKLWGAG